MTESKVGGDGSSPPALTHVALSARHGFFTRMSGERALIAEALGAKELMGVKQVHGTLIATVDVPWPDGHGPEADGLVTRRAGLAIGIITADCAPVLLCDAAHGVIGAVHAGWRGAAAGVLEEAVSAMGCLGARPGDIAAVIGPCIGQDSYEVGPDLRDAVLPTLAGAARFFRAGRPPDRQHFDLAGYCVARLALAGVRAHALGVDTLADERRFFSHRRRTLAGGGASGHQVSAIAL